MVKLLHVAFCIIALSTMKGMALECYYCNDFDDNGPKCRALTEHSELEECVLVEGYKTYCMSFQGILVLAQQGILAVRTTTQVGEIKSCMSWATVLAPPNASCYHLSDARSGYDLNGIVLESVAESIQGTQCYCNQTNGCNYNSIYATTDSIKPEASPYFGGVGSLRPMMALLLILPVGTIVNHII
ncbi:uncharacterized protein [Asterias amurensis]|uniref:uncharacterized protein n=1 Tax=Asterias amurensis TaxID=7602 RepID=UPI003AB2D18E